MNEVDELSEKLNLAIDYGVEAEVVYSAIQYAKENPECSIIEAINHGLSEWIE